MSDVKVTVVIPNWNGAKFLAPCLRSLERQIYTDFRIIIVDNNSSDNSLELAHSDKLPVEIIRLERNRGFSGAVNAGIRATDSPYVALLNNDTEQDTHWLAELVKALDHDSKYSFAASKMLMFSDRQRINTAGDGMSVYGWAYARGSDQQDGRDYQTAEEIFGASAGAALYRKSLFDDIGLFDEQFFAYLEDVDICFRAQLTNHHCLFVPTAKVYHHVGGTSGGLAGFGQYYTTRNMLLMQVKNWPSELYRKYWAKLLLGQLHWLVTGKSPRRTYYTLKGYAGFIRLLPHALRERRRIERQRTATAKQIEALLLPCFPYPSRLIRILKRWGVVSC